MAVVSDGGAEAVGRAMTVRLRRTASVIQAVPHMLSIAELHGCGDGVVRAKASAHARCPPREKADLLPCPHLHAIDGPTTTTRTTLTLSLFLTLTLIRLGRPLACRLSRSRTRRSIRSGARGYSSAPALRLQSNGTSR